MKKRKTDRLAKEKRLNDENWLRREIQKGKSAQEILEISNEEMAEYYEAAHLFFEKEKYSVAFDIFHHLVTLNPRVNEYWIGLAMSSQMCGDYEGALDAYEMASFTEVESPVPYFFLAQCLFALHDSENAILALDLAVEFAADQTEFQEIKMQAIQVKNTFLGRD